jgi:hypothetical protein
MDGGLFPSGVVRCITKPKKGFSGPMSTYQVLTLLIAFGLLIIAILDHNEKR